MRSGMMPIGVVGLLFAAAPAFAQDAQDPSVDVELFKPHTDMYGYAVTEGAATLGNLQLGVGAWFNYADDPMVLVDGDGNRISVSGDAAEESNDGLINGRSTVDIQLGMGFTKWGSLTVDLPAIVSQTGFSVTTLDNPTVPASATSGGGLGDLRVTPKIAILDRSKFPLGLSLSVPVGLPTGGTDTYSGEGGVSVAPKLIAEFSDAPIQLRAYKWRAAANVGYLVRGAGRVRDISVGNEIQYAAAFGYHVVDPLEVALEFHGSNFGTRASQTPGEALLDAKVFLGKSVAINGGGGLGVLKGIGSPDYRVFLGFEVAPSFDPAARDTDGDKIPDGQDKCPKDAEDFDQFQDTDGCPELDNDADGREDGVDKCPNDPEDDDGYMDNDGCPDPDNDKDGVVDTSDRCPDQAETPNGFQDDDGCPDDKPVDDSDGDGLKDDVDRCPYDAEDLDHFEDEDGCPDKDNDGDSIPDTADKCPNDREIFNGTDDEDGCPDETQRVVLTQSAIKINDVVYFDTGKATIQERSYDLLNEIAKVIVDHPDLKKIRVEGHTDNVGNELGNIKLSQARAQAVAKYLSEHGVDASRLDSAGFGSQRPLVPNDSEANRAKNRRVEFIIVDRE